MKRAIQFIVSLAITVLCFWWTFRHLGDLAEHHVVGGSDVTLQGASPKDAPQTAYQWRQVAGPPQELAVTGASARFRAPSGTTTTTLRFELSVGSRPPLPLMVVVAPGAATAAPTYLDARVTNWDQMWASLKSANYLWLVPYLLILTLIHLCRTLRWGNLLSPFERVRFRPLNEAAGIGFMMLVLLPFRLGEFARPFLIAQRSRIRRSPAMLTVVLERIVDGLIIAVLLRALLLFVPGESDDLRYIKWGSTLMFLVFGGGFLFLVFAAWQRDRAVWLMRATFGRVSAALGDKVAHVVEGFVGALRQLPSAGQLALFLVYTAIYWSVNGFGMALLANAFDCTAGGATVCAPMHLTPFQGFVVLSVLVAGMMIPAAPGSAGTFQASLVLGLSVFLPSHVVNTSGVAYANVLWVTQMAQQILFGLVLLALSKQSFKDIAGKLSQGEAEVDGGAAQMRAVGS